MRGWCSVTCPVVVVIIGVVLLSQVLLLFCVHSMLRHVQTGYSTYVTLATWNHKVHSYVSKAEITHRRLRNNSIECEHTHTLCTVIQDEQCIVSGCPALHCMHSVHLCFCSLLSVPLHVCSGVDAELVDGQDDQSTTPLNEACICGDLPLVKELLKHGANANAKDPNGMRPLQTACTMGYVPLVKAILDYNHKSNHQTAKKMVEAPITWSKNTVMHLVADNGDLEMMMVLLKYGANPSVQNDDGVAPIHIAASQGHINIAEKLLDSGKNLPDSQCRSPLHYAAMRNQVDMINFLISM